MPHQKVGQKIVTKREHCRLVPGAVPSVMPDLPNYYSGPSFSRDDPHIRAQRKENENIQAAIAQSLQDKAEYDAKRQFSSLQELKDKLISYDKDYWTLITNKLNFMLVHIEETPFPKITNSLIVDVNLNTSVYINETKITNLCNFKFPFVANSTDQISEILDSLKNIQSQKSEINFKVTLDLIRDLLKSLKIFDKIKNENIEFLAEQVSFLGGDKFGNRYSSDTMVFSSLLYTIAPCAYKFIRQSRFLTLPHPNTLNRLFLKYNVSPQSEQLDSQFLSYIKQKFKFLNESDLTVVLMLDEVHIKEFIEYKGGNVCGMAYDAKNCASSAHVFMIKSIISKYKDVVHILPVSNINGIILHQMIRKIIIGLENIGFKVISLLTDNNSINRNALSQFNHPPKLHFIYPHPVDPSRPLFFLVDSVHLLKCIRNNWLNQKNDGKCFFYPEFEQNYDGKSKIKFETARFNAIKDLYNLESDELVRYGFKLNLKALSPSNMERQNVKLVLCIFNEFVAQALVELGEKHNLINFKGTSDFLKIILTWWHICNVKSPYKGQRLKNIYQEPLMYNEGDIKLLFLHKFLDWLDLWQKMKCDTGMFSRETHTALILTTNGLIQIANYCRNELNLNYILPGQFQTDDLESRFGNYRRLAGCQYNISTQQLFECEKKLRIQSLLYLSVESKAFGEIKIDSFDADNNNFYYEKIIPEVFSKINVTSIDLISINSQLPLIVYLAGYCIFRALKNQNCLYCKALHQLDSEMNLPDEYKYLKSLDRGGLSYPRKHIVSAILYTFIIIKKICLNFEADFIKSENQRNTIISLTINEIDEQEAIVLDEVCDAGHSYYQIIEKVIFCASNIFLNNYVKKKNDGIRKSISNKKNLAAKKSEKRKENSNSSKKQCLSLDLTNINWDATNFEE